MALDMLEMPGTAMVRNAALEASRGASLAVHSAAGLSLATSRDAARLLRAAEGLCRAAVAILKAPITHVLPQPTEGPPAKQQQPPRRRRCRRRPRGQGAPVHVLAEPLDTSAANASRSMDLDGLSDLVMAVGTASVLRRSGGGFAFEDALGWCRFTLGCC